MSWLSLKQCDVIICYSCVSRDWNNYAMGHIGLYLLREYNIHTCKVLIKGTYNSCKYLCYVFYSHLIIHTYNYTPEMFKLSAKRSLTCVFWVCVMCDIRIT